jgi:hypothetical protein
MSHSILNVNAQEADREGAITHGLTDLSDVSGSPSNDDMLVYGGSGWAPAADAVTPHSGRGTGGTVVSASSLIYVNPNPYLSSGDPNRLFWEPAALQQGAGIRMTVVNTSDVSFRVNTYGLTRWTVGFNLLTAGVYALRATCHIGALSADSEYVDCSWTDLSYNKLGPITRFSTRGNKRNTMRGMIDAAANDVAGFYIDGLSSGVYYNQQTYIDVFIEVERLS